MKKLSVCISCLVLILMMFTGCGNVETNMSLSFNLDDGTKVTVTLDTSDNLYRLVNNNSSFSVETKDKNDNGDSVILMQSAFLQYDGLMTYVNSGVDMNELKRDDVKHLYHYQIDNTDFTEQDFIVILDDNLPGLVLGSLESSDIALSVIEHLSFSLE